MTRRRRSTSEKIGMAIAGLAAAGLVVVLVLSLSNPRDPVPYTNEDSGPVRPGVCVTGLPPDAKKDDPAENYGVRRISCTDPSAQLRIMYDTDDLECDDWIVTVGIEGFCATEILPPGSFRNRPS